MMKSLSFSGKNACIQLSQAVPGSIPGRRIIFFNFFHFLLLLFFLFRPLQPQTIEVRLDYSSFASLEFPKFAWHHHRTLDTYTILNTKVRNVFSAYTF